MSESFDYFFWIKSPLSSLDPRGSPSQFLYCDDNDDCPVSRIIDCESQDYEEGGLYLEIVLLNRILDSTMSDDDDGEVPESEVHEWSAFYDDEGRLYYYNSTSGESSWDPPEKFNPPPEAPEEVKDSEPEPQESQDEATQKSSWVAYQDEEGREYYFNTVTEETTWDRPEGMEPSEVDGEHEEGSDSPVRATSPILGDDQPPTPEPEEPMDVDDEKVISPQEEPEEQIDPAIKRLEEAQAALRQTDAIMEPGESFVRDEGQ